MSIDIKNKGIHISNNPALYESSKNNAFDLIIDASLDSDLLMAGVDSSVASEDDYLNGAIDVIRMAVEESSIPHPKIGVNEVKRVNTTSKYAASVSYDEMSIKCTDFVGARVKDYLLAIQRQVYDELNDVVNLASEYKHDWTLVEYTGDLNNVIRKWTLKGCWISSISEENFSQNDGTRSISVTVQFDRMIPVKANG